MKDAGSFRMKDNLHYLLPKKLDFRTESSKVSKERVRLETIKELEMNMDKNLHIFFPNNNSFETIDHNSRDYLFKNDR